MQGLDGVFQGNRTHLRIEGVQNISMRIDDWFLARIVDDIHSRGIHLAGGTSLDLSYCPTDPWNQRIGTKVFRHIARLFPNLSKIDFSCRNMLRRNTWERERLDLMGHNFRYFEQLRELYIENTCFLYVGTVDPFSQEPIGEHCWLLRYCSACLERLDIKGAVFYSFFMRGLKPVPVEMIMKFVRNTPTLRWLRSDLSAANVALLKRERPDVTFVCK